MPQPEPRIVVVLQNNGGAAVSKCRLPRSITLTVALIVAGVGCQEAPDGVAGPLDVRAHHAPGHTRGGGGGGQDSGAGSVVDLSGGYSTAASQPIDFRVTGRAVTANSADDVPVTFAVDGLTTVFDTDVCEWSSNLDAATASALWTESTGKFASSVARWFRMRVNLKENGQPDGQHFTISRHRENNLNWEFKAGTPGDLLGSTHATGTFVDNGATQELTITGGAISVNMRVRRACTVPPVWGVSPASISYSVHPRAYTSTRASRSVSPLACSGLM